MSSHLESEARVLLEVAVDAAGITRSEFADRLGIHRARISDVLNGKATNMTLRTLDQYLAALGYTVTMNLVAAEVGDLLGEIVGSLPAVEEAFDRSVVHVRRVKDPT